MGRSHKTVLTIYRTNFDLGLFIYSGICSTDQVVLNILKPMIPSLAASYLKLFEVSAEMREFFGLRDFYRQVSDRGQDSYHFNMDRNCIPYNR